MAVLYSPAVAVRCSVTAHVSYPAYKKRRYYYIHTVQLAPRLYARNGKS